MNMKRKITHKIEDLNLFRVSHWDANRKKNLVKPVNDFPEFKKEDIFQSIISRFEKKVAEYPDRVAVKVDDKILTYNFLNRTANRVAHKILNEVNPRREGRVGRTVALLFHQEINMIAALLGVLKSGNTYVPLDPNYPLERLVYMLKDSGCGLIVTNSNNLYLSFTLKNKVKHPISIVNIDKIEPTTAVENPGIEIRPGDLAYILYTSGSTGIPKGVVQNHRNVLHFARVYTNALHIHPDDRLTLLSSYSFDAAKMDIYGALLNGAALYPFNIKKEANLNRLAHWLRDEKITIYHSIPTLYRHFTETLSVDDQFPALRFIVMGGEAVYQRDIEKYRKYSPANCLFINGLGPTESTVTLQYFLDKNTEVTREAIPVGYPVEDTEVFLLNDNNQEASMFGAGEIVYKSEYLALGYLNDPGKTDTVFGKNPLTGKDRVYRSGDLGKRLPDGIIDYIGRKDLQVKVRGYRVELGEIESQLLKHPDIKKVVVVTRNMLKQSRNTKPMVDRYICAYFISDQPLASTELREYLSEKLPDYMIPSVFIPVDEIPLTPTGKPDRSALPEPGKSVFKGLEYAAPENETEKLITDIWKEVLMLDQVGVNDNFFDLGGTSIDIIKLITKVKEVFSRDVSVVSIYRYTTIRSFSQFFCREENDLDNHRHHQKHEQAVPLIQVKTGRINQRLKRRESRNV